MRTLLAGRPAAAAPDTPRRTRWSDQDAALGFQLRDPSQLRRSAWRQVGPVGGIGLEVGQEHGALSVMSQGELHALALAMLIPRATTPASPFRFLVLDDPIQAMDPAKIDGFLAVLGELAKTRQVIAFSHDDRLRAAIRARSVPAQLLDVTREQGSLVVVKVGLL